jgi:hypothetical protein
VYGNDRKASGTLAAFQLKSLYENPKVKIHKAIILPVALYGCEIWSPTLREEPRVFVGHKRGRWQEAGENCIMGSFITCACHQILLGWSNQGELKG